MHSGFKHLIDSWNILGIVKGFFGFVSRRLKEIRLGTEEKELTNIREAGEAFSDGWIEIGDLVQIRGRVSRFAPIYFPIAYSPQVMGSMSGPDVLMQSSILRNPAPSVANLRYVDGGVLAFLFPVEAEGTPRITSPVHLDRLVTTANPVPLPYSSAAPSIPVLLDQSQLKHLEKKVAIIARLRPIDPEIRTEIEKSEEAFVRLYYHGFYRSSWFPDQGFLLDARSAAGGAVQVRHDPAPFRINLTVEVGLQSTLGREELESVLNVGLDRIVVPERRSGRRGSRVNYRPAYHTSTGYEIQQVSRLPVVTHLAYEKGVINFGVLADSTADLAYVPEVFESLGREVIGELRRRDGSAEMNPLFASDDHLVSRMSL